MSMVFDIVEESGNDCPKCHEHNDDVFTEGQDIECRKCKMIYCRNLLQNPLTLSQFVYRLKDILTYLESCFPLDDGRRENLYSEDEAMSNLSFPT